MIFKVKGWWDKATWLSVDFRSLPIDFWSLPVDFRSLSVDCRWLSVNLQWFPVDFCWLPVDWQSLKFQSKYIQSLVNTSTPNPASQCGVSVYGRWLKITKMAKNSLYLSLSSRNYMSFVKFDFVLRHLENYEINIFASGVSFLYAGITTIVW